MLELRLTYICSTLYYEHVDLFFISTSYERMSCNKKYYCFFCLNFVHLSTILLANKRSSHIPLFRKNGIFERLLLLLNIFAIH